MLSASFQIVVLDAGTMGLPDAAWEPLRQIGTLVLHHNTPHHDQELILSRVRDAEVVLTNKVPINADVIAQAEPLALISTLATGYNIIDLEAAKSRGITVCNVPAYSTPAVAQHTLALILELTNRVGLHTDAVMSGAWVRSEFFYFCRRPIVELQGRTLGLIGFGEIAQAVARLANAFGASILAYRRSPGEAPDFGPFAWAESVETVFEQADIVSLHCPLTPETQHLVNADRLARMKPEAFLINTARGPLVDESALVTALKSGRLAGAALDVVEKEPMNRHSPLLGKVPNLVITPHNGWASEETRRRLLGRTVENVQAFIRGEPVNRVG